VQSRVGNWAAWVAEVVGMFDGNDYKNYDNQSLARESREEINRPSKLCGATNGPKIGEDIAGLRKRDLNGLCVREIANIVQQHRVCSRKRR